MSEFERDQDDAMLDPESGKPSAVLLIEDEPAAAMRMTALLDRMYPGVLMRHASTVAQARTYIQSTRFDLVLVDMQLPDGSGIELLQQLALAQPKAVGLVLSAWGQPDTIVGAIRAGARGYLLKNVDDLEIERSLASVERGGAPIDPVIARRILSLMSSGTGTAAPMAPATAGSAAAPAKTETLLSRRQTEILRAVASGQTNREIAQALNLSAHTVECHTRSIYRKLAVHTRTEAVVFAKTQGWI
ncbi:response regulator transcription factor [Ottowia sp.]|uniref:response regulator transcription factor n=1 Tax=Ottowia sp. TaxID=1898956 RepID=UPI003C73AA52